MNVLTKFEFYKLLRQKSFYVCAVIIAASAVLSMVATKIILDAAILEGYDVSPATAVLSRVDDTFTMLCGIFVALLVCGDFSQQTIKNVYARGFSKTQVYFAKFIAAGVGTLVMFIINYAVSFLLGLALFGEIGVTDLMAYDMSAQLITAFAFTAFTFAVSFIFRKTGVGIALSIVGPMVVNLVLILVSQIAKVDFSLSEYWISGILTKLSGMATGGTVVVADALADGTLTVSDVTVCLVLSAVYTAAFVLLGYYVNKKKDG